MSKMYSDIVKQWQMKHLNEHEQQNATNKNLLWRE